MIATAPPAVHTSKTLLLCNVTKPPYILSMSFFTIANLLIPTVSRAMVVSARVNDVAFKTMYERIGLTTEAAENIVASETIN